MIKFVFYYYDISLFNKKVFEFWNCNYNDLTLIKVSIIISLDWYWEQYLVISYKLKIYFRFKMYIQSNINFNFKCVSFIYKANKYNT